jgi:hypothetical protein
MSLTPLAGDLVGGAARDPAVCPDALQHGLAASVRGGAAKSNGCVFWANARNLVDNRCWIDGTER